jgi:hypothetical protein
VSRFWRCRRLCGLGLAHGLTDCGAGISRPGDFRSGRQEHGREYGEPSASPAVSGPVEEVPAPGVVRVRAGVPGVCVNQGEAAGQPADPALTSAILGTGGVGRSGTAVR